MRASGRRVTNAGEAGRALHDLICLDRWLTGGEEPDEDYLGRLEEPGEYRGRPNTYGGPFWMRLAGGDDLGLQVDREGFVIELLAGHIR